MEHEKQVEVVKQALDLEMQIQVLEQSEKEIQQISAENSTRKFLLKSTSL